MRLVLDTNIVVSTLLWRGAPYRLLGLIRDRRETVTLFTSAPLLAELADVLARPTVARQLAVIQRSAAQLLADYADAAEIVQAVPIPRVAPDPDDDAAIATALAARADLLVTGDKALLGVRIYQGVEIVGVNAACGRISA